MRDVSNVWLKETIKYFTDRPVKASMRKDENRDEGNYENLIEIARMTYVRGMISARAINFCAQLIKRCRNVNVN